MRSTANSAPRPAEQRKDQTYHHQDDADRPQNPDPGYKADDQKYQAKSYHRTSPVVSYERGLPSNLDFEAVELSVRSAQRDRFSLLARGMRAGSPDPKTCMANPLQLLTARGQARGSTTSRADFCTTASLPQSYAMAWPRHAETLARDLACG